LHPLISSFIHVVILGGPILAGLYYTDTLDLKEFTTTLLVAPPPPRPPPPAPAAGVVKAQTPKRVFMNGGKFVVPIVILKKIAEIKEAALEPTRTRTTPWTVWLCQSCSSMERRAHNRNVSIKFSLLN
jgi:uncharacterized protein YlaI